MKLFIPVIAVFLLAGCGRQPETDPALNLPAAEVQSAGVPDLTAGIDRADREVCRANMQTAAAGIVMYQAQNGSLPESLEQASSVPARCPQGGQYIYTVEGGSWRLECPAHPSHGFIENGTPGW